MNTSAVTFPNMASCTAVSRHMERAVSLTSLGRVSASIRARGETMVEIDIPALVDARYLLQHRL